MAKGKEKVKKGTTHGISEIAEAIDMGKNDTREVFNDFREFLEKIAVGDKVSIPKFGIFEKVVKKPRKARNPHTGETIMTKKKVTLKFRLASNLRDL